ncbi:MAG: DUF370 domain-containing protein [Clostridia bacterium]|nr:DUF370 domain-containing protein [Clostridia bacterium]
MFLHAGNNKTIKESDIIGIFDADTATVEDTTKEFLRRAEKEGRSELIVEELPKSFIVTRDNKVYFSQISTSSLYGRAGKKAK